MRLGIRPQALLLTLIPLASLLVMLALTGLLAEQTQQGVAATQRLADILQTSAQLSRTITAASISVQDYMKTKRAADLAPYETARVSLPVLARRFNDELRGSTILAPSATAYSRNLLLTMDLVTGYLQAYRRGGPDAARAFALTPAVRRLTTNYENSLLAFDQAVQPRTLLRVAALRTTLRRNEELLFICEIASFLLTVLVSLLFARRIVQRLGLLSENARRLADGTPTLPAGGNDEITELDRIYHQMADRIADAARAHEETLLELNRERDVTAVFQQALLPEIPAIPGLRIDTFYATPETTEIGGDWFDVFVLSDRLVGLSIGDVTGHGLRAAAVMGFVRQAIRIVARREHDPTAVMQEVNEILCADERGIIVTAFFGLFDRERGALVYTLAGHGAPLVATRGDGIAPLEGAGLLLGVDPTARFNRYERRLVPGDSLVLYTDGIVEADRNYLEGMRELEHAIASELQDPAPNIAAGIHQRVFRDRVPRDDSALLTLTVTELEPFAAPDAGPCWYFDARNEAVSRGVKRELLRALAKLGPEAPDLTVAEMVYGELLSNIVRHTPGPARVGFTVDDGRVVLRVADHGALLPSTVRIAGDGALPEFTSESGRGLFLVTAMCERITSEPTPDGKCITVVLPVAVDDASAAAALATS